MIFPNIVKWGTLISLILILYLWQVSSAFHEGYEQGYFKGRYATFPIIRKIVKVKKVVIFNCDAPGPLPYIPPTYQDIPDLIDADSVRHHI